MTGEFQQFLEQRAQRDVQYLQLLHGIGHEYMETDILPRRRENDEIIAMSNEEAEAYIAKLKDESDKYEPRTITRSALTNAMHNDMILAGESIMWLKQRSPTLFEEYPDLVCFRRLRDLYAHPERNTFDKDKSAADERTARNCYERLGAPNFMPWIQMFKELGKHRAEWEPVLRTLCRGLNDFQIIHALLHSTDADEITTNDAKAYKIYFEHGHDFSLAFEVLLEIKRSDSLCIRFMDAADTTSSFAKQRNATPISREALNEMMKTRNQLAHVNYNFVPEDEMDAELEYTHFNMHEEHIEHWLKELDAIKDWGAYRKGLVANYTAQILGAVPQSPEVLAVLDRAVDIAKGQGGRDAHELQISRSLFEEAFMRAAGKMLRRVHPAEAHRVLDAIERRNSALLAGGGISLSAPPQLKTFIDDVRSEMPPIQRGRA